MPEVGLQIFEGFGMLYADDIHGLSVGMEFGLLIPLRTMDHLRSSSGVF